MRAMRHVVETVTATRVALSARRDLLLEVLALHHQVAVLARSNRRLRPSDRLLWLVLRRLWRQWRDALVLVQPATVDRWYRDLIKRRWWRRSRRPGRPRINSQCRELIARLAQENHLWGAPRIHGELLKLGIVVSERTVSRYLAKRRAISTDILHFPARVLVIIQAARSAHRQSVLIPETVPTHLPLALRSPGRPALTPDARACAGPWSERRAALHGHAVATDGQASHDADRLASIRVRRAAAASDVRSAGTASPVPKYISSGVCPRNAECGSTRLCWST